MSVSLLQAPYLKKGDKVAVVATANAISYAEIAYGINVLQSWGLEVEIGKTLGLKDGIYAGSDEERANDLQQALDDSTIKAIIFARGGYGTVRIIDMIDFTKFMRSPKWVCGYSDITVLHTHINHVLAIQTLHSTMLSKFETCSKDALETFRKALFGEPVILTFDSHPMNVLGNIETTIYGGNLSILYSLTGTNTSFSFHHKSLFIEDIDEYLYHLDRMMMNMKRGGKLKNIESLIVGGFTDMKESTPAYEKTAEEIIKSYITDVHIPVCFNVPAGHIIDNRTIILGKKCLVQIQSKQVIIDFT